VLLGKLAGYLVMDRWSGYGWWPLARQQVCWAHLIREFQKIAKRGGGSQRIGEGLLEQARQLFKWWHRVRDGTLTQATFAQAVVEIRGSGPAVARTRRGLQAGARGEVCPGANRTGLPCLRPP
jgi:hypothetical protein